MSELEPFVFPDTGQSVRTVVIGNDPWFVAADVARILGYRMASDMTRRLDNDEKGTHAARTPGGTQEMTVVSEAGLYTAILGSQVPDARAFKRWVTHEVLPAIRRTGRYELAPSLGDPLAELERQTRLTTRAIEIAKAERVRAEAAERRAAELEPDAARARQTMDADGLALIGTVAKRFGMQEKRLREFLYAQGIVIRTGSRRNEPMARYVQAGYFEVKVKLVNVDPDRAPVERSVTYVTPKGEAFVWRRLVAAGVRSGQPPGRQLALVDVRT